MNFCVKKQGYQSIDRNIKPNVNEYNSLSNLLILKENIEILYKLSTLSVPLKNLNSVQLEEAICKEITVSFSISIKY